MLVKSDAELLSEYAEIGAEAAFTELVSRHTKLVYSAAVRQVDSPEQAADITQRVFIALASAARDLALRLANDSSLAGWLCRTTRNLTLNLRRDEFRRRARERQAMEILTPGSEVSADWEAIRPLLDEVMSQLGDTDYDAVVLRFFNNLELRAVARALGVTEDAAQKRVSRATEKLRRFLSRRGISTTSAALSVVLSANAVQAAPAGLNLSVSTAALLSGATSHGSFAAATTNVAMTATQKALITTTILTLTSACLYERHQASTLRTELRGAREQLASIKTRDGQIVLAGAAGYINLYGGPLIFRPFNDPPVPISFTSAGLAWLGTNVAASWNSTNAIVNRPPASGQADLVLADSTNGAYFSASHLGGAGLLFRLGGAVDQAHVAMAQDFVMAAIEHLAQAPPVGRTNVGLVNLVHGPVSGGWTAVPVSAWQSRLQTSAVLAKAGINVVELPNTQAMLDAIASTNYLAVVNPYGEWTPSLVSTGISASVAAIGQYVRAGGNWFETGGYSFYYALLPTQYYGYNVAYPAAFADFSNWKRRVGDWKATRTNVSQ